MNRLSLFRSSIDFVLLGGLFAYAARRDTEATERDFVAELSGIADFELTAETALGAKLRRICEFFHADACVVLYSAEQSNGYLLQRAETGRSREVQPPIRVADFAALALLPLPQELSLSWSAQRPLEGPHGAACRQLANLLEADHFATVPYRRQQRIVGRLFLVSAKRAFKRRELAVLAKAAPRMSAVVDVHARLDELRRSAARAERSRISRDIHDTTIQPYIGLKYGLEALYRRLPRHSSIARQVKELLDMSSTSVEDLRSYVAELEGSDRAPPEQTLPIRLMQQAHRYRAYWGIDVELRIARELQYGDGSANDAQPVSERLAAEVYQAACEALSNVRRHTRARRAFIALRCDRARFVLEVGNERSVDSPTQPFMPRSLMARASALGGVVQVHLDAHGHDVVQVSLPRNPSQDGFDYVARRAAADPHHAGGRSPQRALGVGEAHRSRGAEDAGGGQGNEPRERARARG